MKQFYEKRKYKTPASNKHNRYTKRKNTFAKFRSNIAETVTATVAVRAKQQHIIQVPIICDAGGGLQLNCKYSNAMEVNISNFRLLNIAHFTYFVIIVIRQDLSTKSSNMLHSRCYKIVRNPLHNS